MPAPGRTHNSSSWRDSWPPTQLPLYDPEAAMPNDSGNQDHSNSDDTALVENGQDPLYAFLTPTPLLDDGDTDDDDNDAMFDAGIEDSHQPALLVRSVSPSKLRSGFGSPPHTPTRLGSHSPPSLVSTPDYDYDDEEEEYVRFPSSSNLMVPVLGSSAITISKSWRKTAAVAAAKAQEKENDRIALMMMARGGRSLSYNDDDDDDDDVDDVDTTTTTITAAFPHTTAASWSFSLPSHVGNPPQPSGRGRSFRPMLPVRPRSWAGSSGRVSPRAWREPSPDVWSIEEEEEGVVSEMELNGGAAVARGGRRRAGGKGKRVRFALPLREDIP